MIYLRLRGTLNSIMAQVAYAEHLSKLYNQPISLYTNGSFDNHKLYYENELANCGLFDKYQFVESYPKETPVIFESVDGSYEQIAERLQQGLDVAIEGDFYFNVDIDAQTMKEVFSPSQELIDYMNQHYAPTENTLYIDLTPGDIYSKHEFAVAGLMLDSVYQNLERKTFDKIILKSDYIDFFQTGGFEEIFGGQTITYIGEEPDARFAESAKIMFPYMCGSSIISNNLEAWWGTVLNPYENKQVQLVFGWGAIKGVNTAPENGITGEVIMQRQKQLVGFVIEEQNKKNNGEPSLFDNVLFEYEETE